MDRIKQLTTAALSSVDSIGNPALYEATELLVDAINELTDAIEALTYDDDEVFAFNYGAAEITE